MEFTVWEEKESAVTFIPGIWTHSTAVPVAFERNSAKVSSAMDKSLQKRDKDNAKHENNNIPSVQLTDKT